MSGTAQSGCRLLIVDDDPTIRLLAGEALRVEGYQVDASPDAAYLMEAVSAAPPELVLLDVMMPGIDGYEACRRLRAVEATEHIPVLMMTGLDDVDSIRRAYDSGATDFITKPLNYTLLVYRIRYLLRAEARTAAIQRSEKRQAHAQRIARLVHCEWKTQSDRMDWSAQATEILGLEGPSMPASWREARRLVHPDDLPQVEHQIKTSLATRSPLRLQLRLLAGESAIRTVSVDTEIECDGAGELLGMTWTVQDITDRLRAEQRIHSLRYYDRVTQLPNVLFLREHLEHLLPLAHRRHYRVGVLAIGFADLARLLAPLGRAGMDDLMRLLGQRLVDSVREADTVALMTSHGFGEEASTVHVTRADNDTFCVVLTAIEEPGAAGAVAGRLALALRQPLSIGGAELNVDARIGIAVFPEDGRDVDILLDHADNALAQAIEHDDDAVAFFSTAFHASSRRRVSLESALRKTIERGELELHYQPKLSLTARRPTGCEALLRWRHAEDGLVAPKDFIPLAEESGLIVPIGQWVVDAALAELAAWRTLGFSALGVAINVSPRQLQDDSFVRAVDVALRTYAVPGEAVEIEIVESLLVADQQRAHAFIGAMHELGVRVALDDFGTGYSSLSYLRQFPIDVLKLDRSFLVGIPDEPAANAVVSGIIALARALQLEVVAEGVELQSQFDFLQAQHCDQVQGYLVAYPQPSAAIRCWLAAALDYQERSRHSAP